MCIPRYVKESSMHVLDYEHIWTWQKPGQDKDHTNNIRQSSPGVIGENWKPPITTEKDCKAFPIELPIWAMKVYAGSVRKSLILDPFVGIGTTVLAAKHLGHNCVGIDNNEHFLNYAVNRIEHPYS
jgi:site-specific DNA-methyltransferase (adenine-specific)